MLAVYRDRGIVNHSMTLAIPFEQRIPELVKQPDGRARVSAAISASLLSAFSNIAKAKMDAEQIMELTEGIIDSAHEDQLSIEDILLFLKDLIMGKAGKITDKIDMPGFFELFETYRTKRYQTLENLRYEQHLNYKNMGGGSRSSQGRELVKGEDVDAISDLFKTYTNGDD